METGRRKKLGICINYVDDVVVAATMKVKMMEKGGDRLLLYFIINCETMHLAWERKKEKWRRLEGS
jgi:hypothetical protein